MKLRNEYPEQPLLSLSGMRFGRKGLCEFVNKTQLSTVCNEAFSCKLKSIS